MAVDSPFSPQTLSIFQHILGEAAIAAKHQAAATLAAAVVQAAGRPFSVHEVLQLQTDFHYSLFPPQGKGGQYEAWKKNRDLKARVS